MFHDELGEASECHDRIETDRFDESCDHLVLISKADQQIVATERLLPWWNSEKTGYYSQTEFYLEEFPKENIAECGRLCILPEHRNSISLATILLGLYNYCQKNKVNFLFGCSSLDKDQNSNQALALYKYLQDNGHISSEFRTTPVHPAGTSAKPADNFKIPKMIRNYIRNGAKFTGAPCYDPEFGVFDFLTVNQMNRLRLKAAVPFIALTNQYKATKRHYQASGGQLQPRPQ